MNWPVLFNTYSSREWYFHYFHAIYHRTIEICSFYYMEDKDSDQCGGHSEIQGAKQLEHMHVSVDSS
jgi:hypothetical protein